MSLFGDICVWGGRNGEKRGKSLNPGQHALSLFCNGMGSVGRMEGGGGFCSSLLGHCWLTKIAAYLRFSRVYPGFLGRKQRGRGGETETNPLCSLLRCYLDHFRAQISSR